MAPRVPFSKRSGRFLNCPLGAPVLRTVYNNKWPITRDHNTLPFVHPRTLILDVISQLPSKESSCCSSRTPDARGIFWSRHCWSRALLGTSRCIVPVRWVHGTSFDGEVKKPKPADPLGHVHATYIVMFVRLLCGGSAFEAESNEGVKWNVRQRSNRRGA